MPKVLGPPKRRGRPRKVHPAETATPDKEEGAGGGESASPLKPREAGSEAESADVNGPTTAADDSASLETPKEGEVASAEAGSPAKKSAAAGGSETPSGQQGGSQTAEAPARERDGSTQTPIEGMDDEKDPSPEKPSAQPSLTPDLSSPSALMKSPRKRGRPPKSKNKAAAREKGEITPPSQGGAAPTQPTPSLSRRVQPRRTLKGKRTASFRYPGESSSDEDEGEKAKGRNVLRRAFKSAEYSDDDVDVDDDDVDRDAEEVEVGEVVELEEGELPKGGVQIMVQTADGLVLSKTPVILMEEGKAQALDPATLSIVTTGGCLGGGRRGWGGGRGGEGGEGGGGGHPDGGGLGQDPGPGPSHSLHRHHRWVCGGWEGGRGG